MWNQLSRKNKSIQAPQMIRKKARKKSKRLSKYLPKFKSK